MRYGSVCSGIEAASVAWEGLGWKPAWFSEIEPFPSAVLAYHYPDVANLGDMTKLPDMIINGEIEAPDVLCGGTPCQAFSVAGNRQSLDDHRGNLTLTFCEIADAIDSRREQPAIIFWENVPGVLNTKDNAFGCFLGKLAGEDGELLPSGKKWTNAGCVFGSKRTVAWRVLDAQYFGLAQRRRRVFVVASARNDFNPTEVLFEFEGMRRDTPKSRGEKEGFAGKAQDSIAGNDKEVTTHRMVAFGEYTDDGTASAMKARDYKDATDLVVYETHPQDSRVKEMGDTCQTVTMKWGTGGGNVPIASDQKIVRRLTPTECERLQGFPDGYTQIPWRNKPASECPDGPRYKALGNSWAVPVVRWIGSRM